MRKILISLYTFITFITYSQEVRLFEDSLALDFKRTWIDIKGSPFTEIGESCNYGMEITFTKENNQGVLLQCFEGVWKESDFKFIVKSSDGEHFIELYNKDMRMEEYEIEAQLISDDGGKYKTELTFYSFRDRRTYTLRSKKL